MEEHLDSQLVMEKEGVVEAAVEERAVLMTWRGEQLECQLIKEEEGWMRAEERRAERMTQGVVEGRT